MACQEQQDSRDGPSGVQFERNGRSLDFLKRTSPRRRECIELISALLNSGK